MATSCAVRVHRTAANQAELEKRHTDRQRVAIDATSYPLEIGDAIAWGGTVKDISAGGIKLALCFPFGPGTCLTVELQTPAAAVSHSLACRVVHVHDHADGTWTLGCEFIQPLSDREVELLL